MTAPGLLLGLLVCLAQAQEAPAPEVAARGELLDDFGEAQALARRTRRPLVVFFGAVWCSHCRTFKKRTLGAPEVRALGDEFCWVYVEIEREVTLARSFGARGTPHLFVLSPDGENVAQALGALGPDEFRDFLVRAQERLVRPFAAPDPLAEAPAQAELEGAEVRWPLTWTPQGYRAGSICYSHVGYGPLNLPSQAPGQVLRLGFQPRVPSTLAAGQAELGWSETVANIFAFRENDYRLDYMTLNSVVSLAYGITDTVLVEVELSDLSRFDSYLDPVTDAFHDVFGLGDSGRDRFPERDNVIDLEPQGGVGIEDRSSGSESQNVALSLQHNLTCGTETWPALAYGVDAIYHLGGQADLDGRSKLSVALSASMARRMSETFYAYLCLGHVWHGLDEWRGLPLESRQWSGLAAVEWRYAPTAAFVLQYLVTDGVASARDPFDDPSNEVNLGWKKEVSSGLVIEIGLIENVIEPDNSPDFGLHFGLRKRF